MNALSVRGLLVPGRVVRCVSCGRSHVACISRGCNACDAKMRRIVANIIRSNASLVQNLQLVPSASIPAVVRSRMI